MLFTPRTSAGLIRSEYAIPLYGVVVVFEDFLYFSFVMSFQSPLKQYILIPMTFQI